MRSKGAVGPARENHWPRRAINLSLGNPGALSYTEEMEDQRIGDEKDIIRHIEQTERMVWKVKRPSWSIGWENESRKISTMISLGRGASAFIL
jgi:hypothetical protein